MKKSVLAGIGAVILVSATSAWAQRDSISIVGSSTVYPFSTVVAERFGKTGQFKTPKVESTGTGGGLKLFCSGVGVQYPDMTNASRAIKASEIADCASNGVTEIVEVVIGFDGIVIANSAESEAFELTRRELYLALAKDIPNPDGSASTVANPNQTWQDVNPALPAAKIEVLGPPPTSGTRDAFAELVMEAGCESFEWLHAIKKTEQDRFKAICMAVREDGAYVEAGENDNLIVQKLAANPQALGIFGYSFLEENEDKVQGASIEGVEPGFDAISDGSYSVSRPLFFYVKKQHIGVVPGIKEFVDAFISERAIGEEGYLTDRGLIPLPEDKYEEMVDNVSNLKPLAM